jgi:hypothetical protein
VKARSPRTRHAEGAYAHRFQVRDGRRQHVARLHHVNQARPIEAMRSASISTSREVARRVRMRAERERSDEARGRFEVGGAVSLLRPSPVRLGATFRPSSKLCASSGCPRASNEAHSRVAQAGKGVLVRLTFDRTVHGGGSSRGDSTSSRFRYEIRPI